MSVTHNGSIEFLYGTDKETVDLNLLKLWHTFFVPNLRNSAVLTLVFKQQYLLSEQLIDGRARKCMKTTIPTASVGQVSGIYSWAWLVVW